MTYPSIAEFTVVQMIHRATGRTAVLRSSLIFLFLFLSRKKERKRRFDQKKDNKYGSVCTVHSSINEPQSYRTNGCSSRSAGQETTPQRLLIFVETPLSI